MSQSPPTPAAWYSTSGPVSAPWCCTYPRTWTVARSRSAPTPARPPGVPTRKSGNAGPPAASSTRLSTPTSPPVTTPSGGAAPRALADGDYTIWRGPATVLGVVTIEGGRVASYHWG